jgi:threonine dehydrogenase-like Zn-dependent dehydrogenase
MEIVEVPDAGDPGAGEILVRPESVGLCGSDFHYFLGDLGTIDDPSALYPRIQGHEVSAVVEEVGSGCPEHLRGGTRVALWPVRSCGQCYPCRIGRGNVCANLRLIGVHVDGGLQERLRIPAVQAFPVGEQGAAATAVVEPVAIAVRAVARGRVAAGERAVVFGAGPIGQALALAMLDRGASILLLDRLEERVRLAQANGAEAVAVGTPSDALEAARAWAGPDGPELVFEATGVPELVATAAELVSHAGRVVVVGLSGEAAPLRVGDLPFKELDLLGVSCCSAEDFAEAVALVGRRREAAERLVTHEFPLEQAPDAIEYAMENPAEAMKVVVRLDDRR